jgi:hypothetical protein
MAVTASFFVATASSGATFAVAETCPNEVRRTQQHALGLPDCRAYELVTPGALLGQDDRAGRAAVDGGVVTYYTNFPAPDAASSSFFYLARRGLSGWSLQSVGPQNAAAAQFEGACEQNVFFSPDLSSNILEAGWFEATEAPRCKHAEIPLVFGEPDPYRNVFVHDIDTNSNQLVNVTPSEVAPANAKFQDASDDLSHVVFSEEAKLTPEAPAGNNFYLWSDGLVRLLTFLPNGTPAPGELVEAAGGSRSGFAPFAGAMSSDGRRVFFYSGGNLYLRENADQSQSAIAGGKCSELLLACTVEVDASQGPGFGGGGVFWRATPDGSTVFFTDESKLTGDSTAESNKPDLYRYEVDSEQLIDVTAHPGEAADVRGVSGMGESGSYLYFVANGVLAPGASPGDCRGSTEALGQCNLYVLHEGSIAFIATLSRKENLVWQETPDAPSSIHKTDRLWANVSPNGRFLAFLSYESLTGYDNTDAKFSTIDREIFLYDAAANGDAGELVCVSCPPGPAQNPFLSLASAGNYAADGSGSSASWLRNAVLDDGSVFFDTDDALLPQDTNGREDVYEHRAGELHLISGGTFTGRAHFLDASPSGLDVFFRTPQPLVAQDTDNENISLYDARVGGGFPEPSSLPPPCEGESCRDSIEPAPALTLPGTANVRANPKPGCRRTSRRRHCHKHRRRHRHQRRYHRAIHRMANR